MSNKTCQAKMIAWDSSADSAGHWSRGLQQLQEPLQAFVIPHLTARALASLRATCKGLQQLVDGAPVDCMLHAMHDQPAGAFLPKPFNSLEVQHRLRQQAASLNAVLAGQPSSICHIQVPPRQRVAKLHWCPSWPSQTCAVELVRASRTSDPSVSSLHLLELDTLTPTKACPLPPAALPSLCRDQLGWCPGFPTKLWALIPTDDEFQSQLIVMDPAHPGSSKSLDSQYCGNKKWVSSDGSKAVMYSNHDGRLDFRIFSLADLEQQARISFPSSHGIASCSTWEGQAKVRWSPSGQLVAVLWDATHVADDDAHLGPLTIHDASSGSVVFHWHPWAGISQRSTYQFACAWAPSSATVVVAQLPRIEAPGSEGCFTLLRMDGTHSCVQLPGESYLESVSFSPCGVFICWEADQMSHGSGGIVSVTSAALNCNFRSTSLNEAFSGSDRFIWFPACSARQGLAVLPGLQGFAVPPACCVEGLWSRQAWHGLDIVDNYVPWFQNVVSPCGTLIVGAVHAAFLEHAPLTSHCRPALAEASSHGLFIAPVRPEESSCCFSHLPAPQGLWLPDRIAWRPCSANHVVFAIPTKQASIHILDGMRQKLLCSYELLHKSGAEVLELNAGNSVHVGIRDVSWSPDGCQLAVAMNQNIVILKF
ncbi:hypothetical protein WJX74_006972 [Apatococcus lobatus]|uniref:Uncharacterized protein n=1 Tax=Apatococcus lobatus TaxID=904363 RepID=A0AAW1RLM2_9CHLO